MYESPWRWAIPLAVVLVGTGLTAWLSRGRVAQQKRDIQLQREAIHRDQGEIARAFGGRVVEPKPRPVLGMLDFPSVHLTRRGLLVSIDVDWPGDEDEGLLRSVRVALPAGYRWRMSQRAFRRLLVLRPTGAVPPAVQLALLRLKAAVRTVDLRDDELFVWLRMGYYSFEPHEGDRGTDLATLDRLVDEVVSVAERLWVPGPAQPPGTPPR